MQNSSGHGERICVAIAPEKGSENRGIWSLSQCDKGGIITLSRRSSGGWSYNLRVSIPDARKLLKVLSPKLIAKWNTTFSSKKRAVSVKIAKRAKDQNVPLLVWRIHTTIYGWAIFYAKLKCMRNENCCKCETWYWRLPHYKHFLPSLSLDRRWWLSIFCNDINKKKHGRINWVK